MQGFGNFTWANGESYKGFYYLTQGNMIMAKKMVKANILIRMAKSIKGSGRMECHLGTDRLFNRTMSYSQGIFNMAKKLKLSNQNCCKFSKGTNLLLT